MTAHVNEPLNHKLITVAAYGLVCPSQMGFFLETHAITFQKYL